jgi:hypothetical protein
MSRRTATRRVIDGETSGAIDFDAALEAYLDGGDPERLLQAAGTVIDCDLPMTREHADIVCGLTGTFDILIETYGDAAHAIRRWFALMGEPGARH